MEMHRKVIFLVIGISLLFQGLVFARSDLEVSGVVRSDQPMAIVNGKMVKEGDEIAGVKVVEIGEDFVKFKDGDKIITKDVGSKSLKSKAKSKFTEYKDKIIKKIVEKKKVESTIEKEDIKTEKEYKLEDAAAAYKRAREELEKVKERNKEAYEAIKRKVEAVKGTGLEDLVSPHSANDEEDLW